MDAIAERKGPGLSSYELEPLLITGLSESANRIKRRLLTYDEIPKNIVGAVVAIEDRRFLSTTASITTAILGAILND